MQVEKKNKQIKNISSKRTFFYSPNNPIDSTKKWDCFVFTWNNYPLNFRDILKKLKDLKYLLVGDEIAPTTNTAHLQGFVLMSKRLRISEFANRIWEITDEFLIPRIGYFAPKYNKSSIQDNIDYCTKLKTSSQCFEIGDVPLKHQGKRNDLTYIRNLVESGVSMRDILRLGLNSQMIKYAELCMKYLEPSRQFDSNFEFHWYFGGGGMHKTRDAEMENPGSFKQTRNFSFWQEYDSHKCVIVDDFRSSLCSYSDLLLVTQPNSYTVNTKGGHRQMRNNKIVLTSCFSPEDVYSGVKLKESLNQLFRRITHLRFYYAESRYVSINMVGDDLKKRIMKVKKFCEMVENKYDYHGGTYSDDGYEDKFLDYEINQDLDYNEPINPNNHNIVLNNSFNDSYDILKIDDKDIIDDKKPIINESIINEIVEIVDDKKTIKNKKIISSTKVIGDNKKIKNKVKVIKNKKNISSNVIDDREILDCKDIIDVNEIIDDNDVFSKKKCFYKLNFKDDLIFEL